jgi:titin
MSAKSFRVAVCAGLLALLPLVLAYLFIMRPDSASAVIFVVNSTGDQSDLLPGDGVCLTVVVPPTCTLRAAIQESNAFAGADIINFAIPGVGPHTITPATALPPIIGSVTIDGYTQPGALANSNPTTAGSNAVLIIELDGTSAGAGSDGLVMAAGSSTVKGLVINRFSGSGIELTGSGSGRTVEGNFIGTDVAGASDFGNGAWGVLVLGSSNSTVGGTSAAARNVISGNDTIGIEICCSGVSGTVVQGNLIGTDKSGSADLGNNQWGILINGSPANTIGGTASGARNVISGNNTIGIEMVNPEATGNLVQGNYIGTDVNGTADLGNGTWGILLNTSPGNTIGGTAAGAKNVISGNNTIGIEMVNPQATGNVVQGNYIGTDANGSADLGNGTWGVLLNTSPGNTIGGTVAGAKNVISGNNTIGIEMVNPQATGNLVQGNYIGTDANGSADLGNGTWGILVNNATGNTIGGTASGERNLISGNGTYGIEIVASLASGNVVAGNYIGTDATGTLDLGNTISGVFVNAAPSNTIGGSASGARNVISGNDARGLVVNGNGNIVEGNYIGTDATGSADLGNTTDGVAVFGANNTIGGTGAGARNVISGNNSHGIEIAGGGASGNMMQGNYIGTDATGTLDLGNNTNGILISSAPSNTIGGTAAGARNIISGNTFVGVVIQNGAATGNLVQGNFIGTDVSGTLDVGNSGQGVIINNAPANLIGGTAGGAGNVISGNSSTGVLIQNSGSTGNIVQGNLIGTQADGISPLGQSSNGIFIVTSASNNTIGGTGGVGGNVIAHNGLDGVHLDGSGVMGNLVRSNSIFLNADQGINLAPVGVNANDPGDADSGPNDLQNYPVLTSATSGGGSTTIAGTLNSTPNSTFDLDFYSSPVCDPSAFGEGQTYLGSGTTTTDGSGNAPFTITLGTAALVGNPVTATATNSGASTSEFSQCITAVSAVTPTPSPTPCPTTCPTPTPSPSPCPTNCPTPSPTPCATNCPPTATPSPTPCPTNCPVTPTPSPQPTSGAGGPNPVGGQAGLLGPLSDEEHGRPSVEGSSDPNGSELLILLTLLFGVSAVTGLQLLRRRLH